MKALGSYFSFISVLTVAYTLFLRIVHDMPPLLLVGGAIGFCQLASAYLLLRERRSGLLAGLFLSAIMLGFSGYFLGAHYFSTTPTGIQATFSIVIPDLVIVGCSLLGFLVSLSLAPFRHADTPQYDRQREQSEQ